MRLDQQDLGRHCGPIFGPVMLEARDSRKWQPCSILWSQKGLPEWIQEHVSVLPFSSLFSPISPGTTGHLLTMQHWSSDSLLLLLFSSFLLTILFAPFLHSSHAFQRLLRSGGGQDLAWSSLWEIPFQLFYGDSCPDLSQRVNVVPWEHCQARSVCLREDSEDDGGVLGSCVLSFCVTISLQRSQLPMRISSDLETEVRYRKKRT